MTGRWRLTLADEALAWSAEMFPIHGLPVGAAPPLVAALDHFPPDARARVAAALARAIETGEPFASEQEFRTARAERCRVRLSGVPELADGCVVALTGMLETLPEQS